MSIMARARAKDPQAGYAERFRHRGDGAATLPRSRAGRASVISNAGGVNPGACAEALRAADCRGGVGAEGGGGRGDDLIGRKPEIAARGAREMFSGGLSAGEQDRQHQRLSWRLSDCRGPGSRGRYRDHRALRRQRGNARRPASTNSAGGGKISTCWPAESLAGHILECGPQATGGNFTDWEEVVDTLADIGYPIAEVAPMAASSAPSRTAPAAWCRAAPVGEQMLYEIGDPHAYLLPDVACDFSAVSRWTRSAGPGAGQRRARAPAAPGQLQGLRYLADGFRGGDTCSSSTAGTPSAGAPLRRCRAAPGARCARTPAWPDFDETCVEIIRRRDPFRRIRRDLRGAR